MGHVGLVLVALGVFLRSTHSTQTNFTFEDTLTQIGLGYPFLFEPWFASYEQSKWWSVGYAAFTLCCAALAWRSRGLPPLTVEGGHRVRLYPLDRGLELSVVLR